ncbi:MAG TPA: DUF4331 family protein [Candidatus Bathyarchaeia archaeon]|nr:DUF4331 family protein [Candidatus Bathyarchaeia archaeon]
MIRSTGALFVSAIAFGLSLCPSSPILSQARAADHGDGPFASVTRAGDIGDVFMFLDPNDNSQIVMAMTVQGFIAPGESVNFTVFDPTIRFRFEIETSGDARPDTFIDVSFSPRTSSSAPQTATVVLPSLAILTAPTTVSSENADPPDPTITVDPATGVSFFAGEVDDPFFFDIPAFNRFVASVVAGSPDPSQLQRGRDSFAGYNTLAIALRMPLTMITRNPNAEIGLAGRTQRAAGPRSSPFSVSPTDRLTGTVFSNIDRMGNPAVNVALIPFADKDAYNAASEIDDANGKFVGDIVKTLTALGTNSDNINTLAQIAVVRGDYLRIKVSQPNTGPSGGNNAAAAYPNGRRLADDTIDTILGLVSNGALVGGDHVDANDVPLRDEFPFFAAPQQPRAPGVIDDNTRS